MSRYTNRKKAINNKEMYDELFEKRGVKSIVQYRSPKARYISDEELNKVDCIDYVWSYGDDFWKLATQYYGDPNHWWVIATFNRKPTPDHVKYGEKIKIPKSLSDALQVIE